MRFTLATFTTAAMALACASSMAAAAGSSNDVDSDGCYDIPGGSGDLPGGYCNGASKRDGSSDDVPSKIEDAVDEAGNRITFITGQGDHDFDDDDDDDEGDHPKVVRRSRKHHNRKSSHKSGKHSKHSTHASNGPDKGSQLMSGDAKITWYASNDLKNPQCGDGKWNPDNNSHIGAVMAGWKNGPQCGEFVQLCNDKMSGNPCLRVRVVDKCAGCKTGVSSL